MILCISRMKIGGIEMKTQRCVVDVDLLGCNAVWT
jgi:hypothetical protein